ncbi:MAG TPA: hypothetical protein VG986_06225, partial [Pseudolabrys sp.]|nr:hypothetical protein [Pseudolabrys sp.]
MSSITIRGLSAAAMACVALALPPLAVRVTAQTVYTGNGVSAAVTSAVTLRPRGAWSASVTYLTNDLVTSRGSTWRAKRSSKGKVPGSTSPSTAADWELFAEGLNPQGNWISTATYNPNDLV